MNTYITPSPYGTPYSSLRIQENTKKQHKRLSGALGKTYPPRPYTNTFLASYCSPAPTQSSQNSSEIRPAEGNIRQTADMFNQIVSRRIYVDRT